MSCISLGTKDFLKMKTPTTILDSQLGVDDCKKTEPKQEETEIDKFRAFLNECEDSNQTLDLFKSYRPLVKPEFDNGRRKPSLLENSLLPGLSGNHTPSSLAGDKGVEAQLTIFYRGQINVYNNVPFEKAQDIMVLAGESSLSAPIVTNLPEKDVRKTVYNQQNLPSICKLQADLPIARKFSLKCFLEKRRDRITSNAPYHYPETKHDKVPSGDDDGDHSTSNDNNKNEKLQKGPLVLSPFPSRRGNSN